MLNTEYFYPTMEVQIGQYHLNEGIKLDVYSSKESYFDWAKISFTDKMVEVTEFKEMEEVNIFLGYEDENEEVVFEGYVDKTVNNGDTLMDQIVAKDEMKKLEKTKITETFLNTSPQEILMYGLDKAGIDKYELNQDLFTKKSIIPISQKNVIQLINEIHRTWNIEERFFFSQGKIFYWGIKPKQKKIYEFTFGENIINMEYENGFWMIETISVPHIKHSHKISVQHPRVEGIFEVYKVHFLVNDKGFPRTKIYFKEDEE
jgi:hypothetical protein